MIWDQLYLHVVPALPIHHALNGGAISPGDHLHPTLRVPWTRMSEVYIAFSYSYYNLNAY